MRFFNRGNAVPETALAVSFTLLMLFGLVQFATTTFYQVSADGASFVGAHDAVANVGNPTSANQSDAASAAATAFSKIISKSVSVLNPSNSTFETDIAQQVPGISALGNPAALTINSRLIEETAGTAGSSQLPPSALDCSQTAENIIDNSNSGATTKAAPIVNKAVGVTQATQTIVTTNTNGTTTLSLDPTPVTNELTDLDGLETDVNNLVSTLNSIPSLINTTLAPVPGASAVAAGVENAVSNALSGPVASALSGTYSSATSVTSAIAGVNAAIKNVPGVGTLLYGPITTVVDAALTGGGAGNGFLGSNGPLAILSAAENKLDNLMDAKLPVCAAAQGS